MLFNSYVFIFAFLPVAVVIFHWLGRAGRREEAVTWLVIASLVFYGWWNPIFVGLIAASILFNYSIGFILSARQRVTQSSKILLTLGIACNLTLLIYFKYTGFLLDNFGQMIVAEWKASTIILPLAISFFTFQQIAFLVDSYRGITREYRFLHYCLFVTFFPQLIAGPIVHHKEMLSQFGSATLFENRLRNITVGASIFMIGLFKKTIIADGVGVYADAVFDGAAQHVALTFFEAWGGTLAFTFQLYFDFSAYSDMAVGLATMFGIRLPVNFFSPYKANSIIDFWRLWHITLSRFLRNHLYIPLGGNRKGRPRRYVNLMITMLLGGLWHGAGWTFIIWGGLHGGYLIINHAWRALRRRFHIEAKGRRRYRLMSRLLTFLSIVVAWVFFRAENLATAKSILQSMTGFNGVALPKQLHGRLGDLEAMLLHGGFNFDGMFYNQLSAWIPMAPIYLLLLWVGVWFLPNTYQIFARYRPALYQEKYWKPHERWRTLEWQPSVTWAVLIGSLATIAIFGLSRAREFIYYQF